MEQIITIYKNIYAENPYFIKVKDALDRIKNGKSKELVLNVRKQLDRSRANSLKENLPSVCFSGQFKARGDANLIKHSGLICLDFDKLENVLDTKAEICANEYIYACWVSPSGDGLKALIKIADGKKHRLHFQSIKKDLFPIIDGSGINVERICYESYDEDLYVNEKSKIYTKTYEVEVVVEQQPKNSENENFSFLLKWITNKGGAFVEGERNIFLFKLASACCRFGLTEQETINNCLFQFNIGHGSFSQKELEKVVKSSYKRNAALKGTAKFEKDLLVNKETRKEIEIDTDIYNLEIKPKDIIFGEDVKKEALSLYDKGYENVTGIGVPDLDNLFKMKKGEITLLTGIGNYGKSTFLKWMLLVRILKFNEKFVFFSPEDNPAHEFYHDFIEIYAGMRLTPENKFRISRNEYEEIYDKLSKNIFYVYPKDIAPTPDYIKERFLEMVIKENIDGCIIDPFNQMTNEYIKVGGRSDKYLETFLADCGRFAQTNNVYFTIVAHPTKMYKDGTGNYPCPDVFDIADGAMWNNKMDNIIVYHRPNHQNNPDGNECEFHSKKIRRQRIIGMKGMITFALNRGFRRYVFNTGDPIDDLVNNKTPKQEVRQMEIVSNELPPLRDTKGFLDKNDNNDEVPF